MDCRDLGGGWRIKEEEQEEKMNLELNGGMATMQASKEDYYNNYINLEKG